MVAAGTLVLIGGILLVSGVQALLAILGKQVPPIANRTLRFSTALVLVLVWLAASLLAQALGSSGATAWLASPLHLLAIGCPVYLAVRLSSSGLPRQSQVRAWGTLAAGVVCSTGVAAIAEIAILLAGVLAAAAFLVLNPHQLLALERIVGELSRTTAIEGALAVLQPILMRPAALAAVLVAASVFTPVIEEVAKSAAPWLIFDRLRTAAEGFWCGALSGAGFALFEGLMASTEPSGNWTLILLIRAWSSMMHILASAVAGWGIADFRTTRRSSRLVVGYACAIGIHAPWNASVVGIGYGGLRSAFGPAGPDVLAIMSIAAGGLTLLVLAIMLPPAIVLTNRMVRQPGANTEMNAAGQWTPMRAPPRAGGQDITHGT